MTQRRATLFTDDGPHTDRFGLLLLLTAPSITILMFVKLDRDSGSIWFEIGWLAVTLIVGATLMLAFRASGASRRVTMIGDVVMWSTVVLVMVVAIATRIFDVSGGLGGTRSPFAGACAEKGHEAQGRDYPHACWLAGRVSPHRGRLHIPIFRCRVLRRWTVLRSR